MSNRNNLLNAKFIRILNDREDSIWYIQGSVSPGFFMATCLWDGEKAVVRNEVLAARDLANYPVCDTFDAAKGSL